MFTTWVLVIGGIIGIALFLAGVWKIKATERGIGIRLGKMTTVVDSGLRFWYPRKIYEFVRYPTTQLSLFYEIVKPITRKGWYYSDEQKRERLIAQKEKLYIEIEKTEDETVKTERKKDLKKIAEELENVESKLSAIKAKNREKKEEEEGVEFCESVEITKLTLGIYLRYPSGNDLMETHRALGRPMGQKDLEEHFKHYIAGTYREVVGELSWRVIVENRYYIAQEMKRRFSESDSPLIQAKFCIEEAAIIPGEVDLPSKLTELLSKPQEEFLRAEAAKQEVRRRTREIGESIGESAKILKEEYGFPAEEARAVAVERHGDLIVGEKGRLNKIKWETSGGSAGGGPISPETIAQAIVVAQEMLLAGRRSPEEGEPKTGKEKEETYYTRPERGLEVARELAAEREKKKREKKR